MKKVQKKSSVLKMSGYYLLGVLAGLLGMIAMTRIIWHSKFYPNVTIANLAVGGMTRAEAATTLQQAIGERKITLNYNGYAWELDTSSVDINIDESLNRAYRVGRRLDLRDYALVFVAQPQEFGIVLGTGTTPEYIKMVEEIAQTVEIPSIQTELSVKNGVVNLINGHDGLAVDTQELSKAIGERATLLSPDPVAVPTKVILTQLRDEEQAVLKERAITLLPKQLILGLDDERIKLLGVELIQFLSREPGQNKLVDSNAVSEYVSGLKESLNREAVDAKFKYEDGRVTEFAPGRDGIKVDLEKTAQNIELAMATLSENEEKETKIEIVVDRTSPKVTIDKINELGIKERIGRGESYYAHSIPNRVFNVGLAAERTNSVLVPPGEEYSFNKSVGEISGATGYRTAYVISGGRTVLGDGGGVCQVSTTLFRAAMNAGLPITERWAHAYRVGYYEQNSKPGVDATVYSPSKDLRFKNDTPGHILVQTINDPKELHLVVEIYGTSDGRVATVTEPKVSGMSGPLPTIYQDDPSLPTGTMKQVDWAASGAKTSFEYKVERNGDVLQDKVFSSNYRPWASVFLRGTGQ
ncbi:VanW family protein [Candidatus Woesebacteria bacterium]|nr:VanW family protein [Candidatus Woesebacteria bacterium]